MVHLGYVNRRETSTGGASLTRETPLYCKVQNNVNDEQLIDNEIGAHVEGDYFFGGDDTIPL